MKSKNAAGVEITTNTTFAPLVAVVGDTTNPTFIPQVAFVGRKTIPQIPLHPIRGWVVWDVAKRQPWFFSEFCLFSRIGKKRPVGEESHVPSGFAKKQRIGAKGQK